MCSAFRSALCCGILYSLLFSGCTFAKTSSGKIPNTAQEKRYVISKNEPGPHCSAVGGFFGYETPCGSAYGAVPDSVQFSCIRREITNARGNYGVIDAVIGAGWYKGRIFACPDPAPTDAIPVVRACVPGAAQPCTGPGGCQGGQVCADDGSKFMGCDCGATESKAATPQQ
jgi:hypothetical protein